MKAYRIKQWNDLYERNTTRKVDFMPWYPKQTKLTGMGIGCTMAQPDNLELLGLWNLIEILASQSKKNHRGWLLRNGSPLTATMMACLIPTVPVAKWERALAHFSSPEVDWIEMADTSEAEHPTDARETAPPVRDNLPDPREQFPPHRETPPPSREQLPAPRRELPRQTDRQTDRSETDRQTDNNKKKGSLREGEGERAPDAVAVQAFAATRIQYAALQDRKRQLETRDRAKWTPEERAEWQELRADLAKVSKRQRKGL